MKFYAKTFVVLAVCLGVAISAQAKSLGELLPGVVDNHERIQAATESQDAAYFRYQEAKAAWYPKLDLTGDVSEEVINTNRAPHTQKTRNIQKLRATQLLWDFGRVDGISGQLFAAFEQTAANKIVTRQTLLLEGVTAYVDLLKFSKTLGYAMQSVDSFKKQSGIEEILVDKGAGLSSDVLQAKYKLSGAIGIRVAVEGDLSKAKSRYLAIFSHPVTDEDIQQFEIPEVPYDLLPATLDEAVNQALTQNPQLQAAQKNINASEASLKEAQSKYFPSFNAYAEYWRKENDSGQSDVVRTEQRVGVEFKYNLFNGLGDMAGIDAASHEKLSSINTLKDLERTVEQQVRTSWQDLETARSKAEWFRSQASILEGFLELARKERKLGNRSLLDVLSAETDYYNAQIALVGALHDQVVKAYTLLFAMGQLELDLFEN